MIISDHGFNTFRRGVDLNRWLEENGYLKVQDGRRDEKHLAGIDWSSTRAFAVGLAGIFLNIKGKYAQGNRRSGRRSRPASRRNRRASGHAASTRSAGRAPSSTDLPRLENLQRAVQGRRRPI